MKWTNRRIFNIFFGIFIISFFTYITIQHFVTQYKFNNPAIEKRYTIATIVEYIPGAKSPPQFKYSFKIFEKNVLGRKSILSELQQKSRNELKKYIGKRFYVIYVVENPSNYNKLLLDKPVSDSVLKAPPDGWLERP